MIDDTGDEQLAAPRPPPPPVRSGYDLLRLELAAARAERDWLAREFDRVLARLDACGAERDRLRAGIAGLRRAHGLGCHGPVLRHCACGADEQNARIAALLNGDADA